MAKLGQFADVHDSFVELLRTMDRRTLLEWIGAAAGLSFRDVGQIRERSPTIAVLSFLRSARKVTADLILNVYDRRGRLLCSLILELQSSFDSGKRWIWPMLPNSLSAETRKEARVVVFSPNPVVRMKIRRRLLPLMQPPPLLIEPNQIPLIHDAAKARRHPRETIFAAMYHAKETGESVESRVAGIRAAVIAIRTLDPLEQLRYGDFMYSFTPSEILQPALEHDEVEEPEEPLLYRDSYGYVKGEEAGREAGREEALARHRDTLRRLLVSILDARGITITAQIRDRIHQCDDVDRLARWCSKVGTFSGSVDELFDDHDG